MRKYVVPCVALLGIALLSPRADAASFVVKARAIPPGGAATLPVSLTDTVAPTVALYGVDFGLKFDAALVTIPAVDNAFTPATALGTTDVAVTGAPTVGDATTNPNKPNLYVGYLRGGTTAIPVGVDAKPAVAFGGVRLGVAATATRGTTIPLTVPPNYNVENNGQAGLDQRNGATGAALETTNVVNEDVTAVTGKFPGYTATTNQDLVLTTSTIAVGAPGDVNADGNVTNSDAVLIARTVVGFNASFNAYRAIAADVAPAGGWTAAAPLGTNTANGGGYGDGVVTNSDAVLIARSVVGFATIPGTE